MAGATDPAAMGAAPGMEDPNAMPEGGVDPMAGGDPNAMEGDEAPMSDQEESGDSTMDIINQLSPTDREAVRAYAESMLSRDETGGEEPAAAEEAAPAPQDQGIMMEITKGRLIKAQKRINEMFCDMASGAKENETDRKQKKVAPRRNGFKSPFDSPLD